MNKVPYAVFSYIHHNNQYGALVTLEATTDFALRTDIVKDFGNRLTTQIAASYGLKLESMWFWDETKTIEDVLKEISEKLGEKLIIAKVSYHGDMGHRTGDSH